MKEEIDKMIEKEIRRQKAVRQTLFKSGSASLGLRVLPFLLITVWFILYFVFQGTFGHMSIIFVSLVVSVFIIGEGIIGVHKRIDTLLKVLGDDMIQEYFDKRMSRIKEV